MTPPDKDLLALIKTWLANRQLTAEQDARYRQGEAVGRRWAQGGASEQERELLFRTRSGLQDWEWELAFSQNVMTRETVEAWLFFALHPEADEDSKRFRPFWDAILRDHGAGADSSVFKWASFTKGFAEGALHLWCEVN